MLIMRILTFLIFSLLSTEISAAYYNTLPKGVRNFTYRHVRITNIEGDYNKNGVLEPFNFEADINADALKETGIAAVTQYLGTLTTDEYNEFSFGTFETSATSLVVVNAFGLGFGVTDSVTFYAFVPHYNAEVNLNLKRTKEGRKNVGTTVSIENLPDIDEQIIQSLFVNYLGYKPLGTWRAQNFGDTEFAVMYRLSNYKRKGHMLTVGAVAPTGREDDPDILQDIAFGDGQWDAFLEYGGGYRFKPGFSVDSWLRFTYQFPYKKNIRLPESSSGEFLTTRKGVAEIDLGERIEFNIESSALITPQWTLSTLYQFMYKTKDLFKSEFDDANNILEENTEEVSHTFQVKGSYSTVNLFKKKKFFLPANLNLYSRYIFAGKNISKYARFDAELQFFF